MSVGDLTCMSALTTQIHLHSHSGLKLSVCFLLTPMMRSAKVPGKLRMRSVTRQLFAYLICHRASFLLGVVVQITSVFIDAVFLNEPKTQVGVMKKTQVYLITIRFDNMKFKTLLRTNKDI